MSGFLRGTVGMVLGHVADVTFHAAHLLDRASAHILDFTTGEAS